MRSGGYFGFGPFLSRAARSGFIRRALFKVVFMHRLFGWMLSAGASDQPLVQPPALHDGPDGIGAPVDFESPADSSGILARKQFEYAISNACR
jgi:hypothetical protein